MDVPSNSFIYWVCMEFIILNKAGIHKTMSGTRVNKCRNMERRVRNKQRGQGNAERVRIRKSRCIESDNLRSGMRRVNAVLGLGSLGFGFESDDNDFGQSFVEYWQSL